MELILEARQQLLERLEYLEGILASIIKSGMYSTPDGSGHMVVTFRSEDQAMTFYGNNNPLVYTPVSSVDIAALDQRPVDPVVEKVEIPVEKVVEKEVVKEVIKTVEKEYTLSELILLIIKKLRGKN